MRKGKPKQDGSGRGRRANRGRGGCAKTRKRGKGRNPKKWLILRGKRILGKLYIRGLEETAFLAQTFKVPVLDSKFKERGIRNMYAEANHVRADLGEKPKQYVMIKKRKLVKV